MHEALVGRQPIYDRELEVYGYELLFRSGNVEFADFEDGDAATSRVILNAFHQIGIHDVVGYRHAFVNLTRGFIVGEFDLPLPTKGVVLEVLEHVEPDDDVLQGLRDLVARGFTIALDDFVLNDRTEAFLEFASIVKLDILDLGWERVERQLASLRERKLILLAEQVRTLQDYERCRELGFDLYQGYFLSRPYVVRGRRMKAERLAVVRELTSWLEPVCNPQSALGENSDLEAWLEHLHRSGMIDPSESSPEQNREGLCNLAAAFTLGRMEDRPKDLFVSALLRARMCASLAETLGSEDTNVFFRVGLLSTLGSLLECSLSRIVEELPLSLDVRIALLSGTGVPGQALSCVSAYEEGAWEQVSLEGLSASEIRAAYMDAVSWAESVALAPRGCAE